MIIIIIKLIYYKNACWISFFAEVANPYENTEGFVKKWIMFVLTFWNSSAAK